MIGIGREASADGTGMLLVPGDPTSYLVDGRPQRMQQTAVRVVSRGNDGTLTTIRAHETGPDGTRNPTYRCLFPNPPPPGSVPTWTEK